MKKHIPQNWLYLPIIILLIYFIIRLIDQSKLIFLFPLDFTNDYSSYMAQLFFLKECGFHAACHYWYNGITTFLLYPPGWMFFTYPIYILTNNVQISTFISLILMFIISFVFIWIIGRNESFTKIERLAFFLFYFANAINIGNFIRLGRVTEMFAWMLFIAFAGFILWYKNHKIDKKFIFVSLIFGLITISHQTTTLISSILFLSLFLVKKSEEKIVIFGSFLISLLISSFWWIPYIKSVGESSMLDYTFTKWLLDFSGDKALLNNLATILLSIILLTTFYFSWKSFNKSKRELIFFSPILLMNLIFVSRIVIFIPVLRNVAPDSFMMLFMFFSLYFFFKTDFDVYSKQLKKVILLGLVVFAIGNVFISLLFTPFFIGYTDYDYETLELVSDVEGRLAILNHPTSYIKAYYSLIPIKYNLPVVGGWSDATVSREYNLKWKSLEETLKSGRCDILEKDLEELNVTYIISYDYSCENLNICNFKQLKTAGNGCLVGIN